MTRTTRTHRSLNRLYLAVFLVLTPASAALARDAPADPSLEQAAGGACTALASLGELSLSGAPATATVPPTEANADTPGADAESRIADSGSTTAQTPSGPDASGFICLAGGGPASASECAALGGALASTQSLRSASAETPSNLAAEPATEAPAAVASAAAVSVTGEQKAAAARRQKPLNEASQVWWPAPESGRLNLRFAGEAAFGQAIALLFDAPFSDPASADMHVQVLSRAGKVLKGKWQVVKSNPQMLALKAEPGTYTIRIGSDLAASNGLPFKQAAEGKVFVR